MLLQTFDMLPGLAAIVAAEKASGLHAGVEAAVLRRDAPDCLDRLLAGFVGEPGARMRPRLAEIGRLPDGRAEPLIAAAAVDRGGFGVADHMVHRPGLAERAVEVPGFPLLVALENEG